MGNEYNYIYNANKTVFARLKGLYPALDNVTLAQNTLFFPEGLRVPLTEINLGSIPTANFQMSPQNFYIYLNNHFCNHDENKYHEEISQIFTLFRRPSLTNAEIIKLKRYALDFWLRLRLFSNEPCLDKDGDYLQELIVRRKVITESFNSTTLAAQTIQETYNQNVSQSIEEAQSNNTENEQGKNSSKGLGLTRNKPGLPPTIEEENTPLGISGFTSLALIIGVTIAFGIYLALALLD
ncbi:MAG: hypothetical protein K2M17_00445 [Bacilli bacterium]|nr:hypothetical protein [Bacilli bacterium]